MTSLLGAETTISDKWLDAELKADTGIVALYAAETPSSVPRVFEEAAPSNEKYPFIVWQCSPGLDTFAINTQNARILTNASYIVRAVSEHLSYQDLAPYAAAIDQAISGRIEEVVLDDDDDPVGVVLGFTRVQQYRLTEQHEGRIVRHLGGQYAVVVTANEG